MSPFGGIFFLFESGGVTNEFFIEFVEMWKNKPKRSFLKKDLDRLSQRYIRQSQCLTNSLVV